MEGSFAQANRFGLKRARWRGQWRVQIQNYLIAVVQNIELLIAHAKPKPRAVLALSKNNCNRLCEQISHAWLTLGCEFYIGQPATS
jgi:hypothetical protein